MTKHRTPDTRADASKSQLTEQQLDKVCGGSAHTVVAPRDAASGLATGRR
jgi:hypothetical protein